MLRLNPDLKSFRLYNKFGVESMDKKKIQIIWAAALIMAGLGVFYRIPQVMPKIATIDAFADAIGIIRFCFYVLGILLIYGGVKKIYDNRCFKDD